MFTILPNIGGVQYIGGPPRSNIGGVRTPVTPAALTPMSVADMVQTHIRECIGPFYF